MMRCTLRTAALGLLGGLALSAGATVPAYAQGSDMDMPRMKSADCAAKCVTKMAANPDMARKCADKMAAHPDMTSTCLRKMAQSAGES